MWVQCWATYRLRPRVHPPKHMHTHMVSKDIQSFGWQWTLIIYWARWWKNPHNKLWNCLNLPILLLQLNTNMHVQTFGPQNMLHQCCHYCPGIGREMGGGGAGGVWAPPLWKVWGLNSLMYIIWIYLKKASNYCQKASEALSGGQKFQIFLREYAPDPPR